MARRLVPPPDPECPAVHRPGEALHCEGSAPHGLEDDKEVLRLLSRGRV